MTLGLKDLYYAACTEADGAESYGTPKKMAEAMNEASEGMKAVYRTYLSDCYKASFEIPEEEMHDE